jgi:hypothetical protein
LKRRGEERRGGEGEDGARARPSVHLPGKGIPIPILYI